MRIRAWPIILIAGIAVVAIAVMFRDEIWALTGHDPGARSVFGFATPPTAAELARAKTLAEHSLGDLAVTVRADGDRLVVESKRTLDLMEVDDRMRKVGLFPSIELRILDYDPEYLKAVRHALIGNQRAKELGFEVKLDHFGEHLEARNDAIYVNEAWAKAHYCPTTHRLTGTGYYCTVTARDRIAAFLKGDEGLFVTPLDIPPLPDDRELVVANDGALGRGYVVERAPIVLDRRAVASAVQTDDGVVLTLAQPGIDALASRAAGPAVELVSIYADQPREAKLVPGNRVSIAMRAELAREIVDALDYATLPQLRQLPDSD